MSRPKLSVITPSLNQGAYLERTLRSVLDQAYPDLEYIVVDGGSTDESVEILERYEDRLAYWVSEPDRGQAHAINKGLMRATGDVVAYINSDDYYLPGAFETALRPFAENPDVAWVAGACRYVFPDGTVETVWHPRPPKNRRVSWVASQWSVPQASSFWSRRTFARLGAFREDLHYVFDTEFMLRLAIAGVFPVILSDELAVRFLHEDAKSADRSRFRDEAKGVVRDLVGQLDPLERVGFRLGFPFWERQYKRTVAKARLMRR